jgi:hypothetical protein
VIKTTLHFVVFPFMSLAVKEAIYALVNSKECVQDGNKPICRMFHDYSPSDTTVTYLDCKYDGVVCSQPTDDFGSPDPYGLVITTSDKNHPEYGTTTRTVYCPMDEWQDDSYGGKICRSGYTFTVTAKQPGPILDSWTY